MKALPYVDFLFGNENEARTFAKSEGWKTEDVSEIALKVCAYPLSPTPPNMHTHSRARASVLQTCLHSFLRGWKSLQFLGKTR